MLPWCFNTAWMLQCKRDARGFERAARDAAAGQESLLLKMLRDNAATAFGREYGFHEIGDSATYRRRVPLRTYDDHEPYIDRMTRGESNVLTADAVSVFEPTSGSSGGRKLIPYTAGLRRQFLHAINPWIADLFAKRPAVRAGRAYWSVSPALGPPESTPGGHPIGFEDDTAYLGLAGRLMARKVLAVPPSVAKTATMEDFRYTALWHLVQASDLALISVWSPTFLTGLLQCIEPWADRLSHDLKRDGIDPRTARILNSSALLPEKLHRLWPRLALVSCWADGSARAYLPALERLLPFAELQPKGVVATEGILSFPLVGMDGSALALCSHFFEFLPEGESAVGGHTRLAHELEPGQRYQVVLTTAGGLYRYQLFDVIEVIGFHQTCPLIRFIGRANGVSDLVGEKLAEVHVGEILRRVFGDLGVEPAFAMLAPDPSEPPRYTLYLQRDRGDDGDAARDQILAALECGLEENPYYRHAVAMRQLAPVELVEVPKDGPNTWEIYQQRCIEGGQKAGDIKPRALDPRSGWREYFGRRLLD